jgi:hypothetical protein
MFRLIFAQPEVPPDYPGCALEKHVFPGRCNPASVRPCLGRPPLVLIDGLAGRIHLIDAPTMMMCGGHDEIVLGRSCGACVSNVTAAALDTRNER